MAPQVGGLLTDPVVGCQAKIVGLERAWAGAWAVFVVMVLLSGSGADTIGYRTIIYDRAPMTLRAHFRLLLVLLITLTSPALWAEPDDPFDPDTDGDGLTDLWELRWFATIDAEPDGDPDEDGLTNIEEEAAGTIPLVTDSDNDGLSDWEELNPLYPEMASDPTLADTDGDLLTDAEELAGVPPTSPTKADTDQDGLNDHAEVVVHGSDPTRFDTDGGFIDDGKEVLLDGTDPTEPSDDGLDIDGDGLNDWTELYVEGTNRFVPDTDQDGLSDGIEVGADYGGLGRTDPLVADTDGDGLMDGDEDVNADGLVNTGLEDLNEDGYSDRLDDDKDGVYDTAESSPLDPDSDDDALPDGDEVNLAGTHPLLPDTDGDGLLDGHEVDTLTNPAFAALEVPPPATDPLQVDSDGGGVLDGVEIWSWAAGSESPLDPNDPADDIDSDGDGLADQYEESMSGSAPGDPDSDCDGVPDGEEVFPLADRQHSDPLDPDTDDDGLIDGSETGVNARYAGVVSGTGTLRADFDTDGDELSDGQEQGLTGPQQTACGTQGSDLGVFTPDLDSTTTTNPFGTDGDGDQLSDSTEDRNRNGRWDNAIGDTYWFPGEEYPSGETNPANPDSDADGLPEYWEREHGNPDDHPDGLHLNPLVPDDDADPDGDGLTNLMEYELLGSDGLPNPTNPRNPDSDEDGLGDAVEVGSDYDGAGAGTNPNVADTDEDGILDGIEDANQNGLHDEGETHALEPDSDGDGLADGQEDANQDGVVDEGETDPSDADSDDDMLDDGLEVKGFGTDPLKPDTDEDGLPDALELGLFGDEDTESKTHPVKADTDGDGLSDGEEDADKNGRVDEGETDPARADTDGDGLLDGVEVGGPGDEDPTTTTNPFDMDSDDDGLLDSIEDRDRDGAVDEDETDPNLADTDGGGVSDGVETILDPSDPLIPDDDAPLDPDGDGLTNETEWGLQTAWDAADSDGDSIPDDVEVGDDPMAPLASDEDGLIDALDTDSDGDGLLDADEAGDEDLETPPWDEDGDGLPDYRDTDSDGDSIEDSVEAFVDADGDGQADPDIDGDGVDNVHDLDSDGDGASDLDEGLGDDDGDGIPNFADDTFDVIEPEPEVVEPEPEVVEPEPEVVEPEPEVAESEPEVAEPEPEVAEPEPEVAEPEEDTWEPQPDTGVPEEVSPEPPEEIVVPEEDVAEADAGVADAGVADAMPGRLQGGVVCSSGSLHARGEARALIVLALALLLLVVRRVRAREATRHALRLGLPALLWALALLVTPAPAQAGPEELTPRDYSVRGHDDALLGTWSGDVYGWRRYAAGVQAMYTSASLVQVEGDQVLREWVGDRLSGELFGTFGFASFVDLGFAFPFVMWQESERLGDVAASAGALGDMAVIPRFHLLDQSGPLGIDLGLAAEVNIPTGDDEAYASRGFGARARLAVSHALPLSIGDLRLASNLWYGYTLNDLEVDNIEDGDRLGLSLAVSHRLPVIPLSVEVDAYVETMAAAPFGAREQVFAELLGGVGYRIAGLLLRVGGGAGLTPGFGIPRARAFVSVAYAAPEAGVGDDSVPQHARRSVVVDADSDGVPDHADRCPGLAEDRDGFQDEDGCPDRDDDKDGVPDDQDRCPREAEDPDTFQDHDGCPDPDNDGDGILDRVDRCPYRAENKDGVADEDGCPEEPKKAKAAPKPKPKAVVKPTPVKPAVQAPRPPTRAGKKKGKARRELLPDQVLFSLNSARVQDSYVSMLRRLAQRLAADDSVKLVVYGHCSLTGDEQANERLSGKRAMAVRYKLSLLGAPVERITAIGMGARKPIIRRKSEEAHAVNQRVDFVILHKK
jgi:large repetitive protein